MEGIALDCSPGPAGAAVGVSSVGAGASVFGLAVHGVDRFPKATCGHGAGRSCRSTHQAAPRAGRVQGGGGGATRECVGRRPGPCVLARVAGRGRVGVGNERHALRFSKGLTPAASWNPSGTPSGNLENLDLQPALICRSVRESLLFRVFASAAGPLRGHRPVEAPSALHHLVCRVSFDTWRHANVDSLSSFKRPTWGPSGGLPR